MVWALLNSSEVGLVKDRYMEADEKYNEEYRYSVIDRYIFVGGLVSLGISVYGLLSGNFHLNLLYPMSAVFATFAIPQGFFNNLTFSEAKKELEKTYRHHKWMSREYGRMKGIIEMLNQSDSGIELRRQKITSDENPVIHNRIIM